MRAGAQAPTLVVVCAASFIAVVDTTIVTIALPSIQHGLGFSTVGVQWVLNAYALVFGGLLLLLGRVGDLYGRRRLFLLGGIVFALASVLAAAAWMPAVLVTARLIQGIGAAAFVPASLSLLTDTFRPPERNRALGVYGAMAAVGFIVGMAGGGVITQLWGWRWVFGVNAPVAVVMIVAGRLVLGESRGSSPPGHRVDVLGGLTVTAGLILTIYALTAVPVQGWSGKQIWIAGPLGICLLGLFAWLQHRRTDPLVPVTILARRVAVVPHTAIACESMIGVSWLYVLTLYFQHVLGRSPLATGLLFIPMTIASMLAAPIAGRLASGLGIYRTAASGLIVLAGGLGLMLTGMSGRGSLSTLIAGMMIGEAGFMLASVALIAAATTAVPETHGGLTAGVVNTASQLGNGVGLAVVAAVIGAGLPASHTADRAGYIRALQWGLVTCGIFCASTLLLVLLGPPSRSTRPATVE